MSVVSVPCGFPVGLRALLVLAILLAPGAVWSRLRAGCARSATPATAHVLSDELAQSAARIRQARTDFVLSLRRLLEALPGTHGDEGPALRAATAGMSEALGRWDRAIRAYQAPLEKATGNRGRPPGVGHGAVSSAADRSRRPTEFIGRQPPGAGARPDVFLLLGLAYDAAGRHADAAKAFAQAA